jgi:hypothetical protein
MVVVEAEEAAMMRHETAVAETDTMDHPEILNPMIGLQTTIKLVPMR